MFECSQVGVRAGSFSHISFQDAGKADIAEAEKHASAVFGTVGFIMTGLHKISASMASCFVAVTVPAPSVSPRSAIKFERLLYKVCTAGVLPELGWAEAIQTI